MPFIGKQPQAGAYSKLDAITTSATATYNLTLDSGAYYPQSANHLLVSLNGVIQAPQDSFTVSGSQIIFDSALTSADVIDFIIALGDTLDIGVPSAGSVNTSQLANDAVTTAKIAAGAVDTTELASGAVTSAKLDTNIDVAGTLDVTGATTLDSTLDVAGNLDVDGTFNVSDDLKFIGGATPTLGIGTLTPNRKLVVYGNNANGAELSITNTDMTADRRTMNWFMSGDKAHWRILNDAGTAGGTSINLDHDGIIDATAFTGTSGTAYNALGSDSIGDSNVPYNSWGTPNNTYYRWVLPKAGDYRLEATMRIRMWGVHGMILSRLYNNTTSAVINDKYNYSTYRMNLENRGGGTAELFNIQIHQTWIVTTSADNQDIHHQMFSDNNSTSSSVQSDSNGRNYHAWYRIG